MPVKGRITQGVMLSRLDEGDRVVSIALVEKENARGAGRQRDPRHDRYTAQTHGCRPAGTAVRLVNPGSSLKGLKGRGDHAEFRRIDMKLVFIHGSGACGDVWMLQKQHFTDADTPDLPGHPHGEICTSIEAYSDWLHGYFQEKGIYGRCTGRALAGWGHCAHARRQVSAGSERNYFDWFRRPPEGAASDYRGS